MQSLSLFYAMDLRYQNLNAVTEFKKQVAGQMWEAGCILLRKEIVAQRSMFSLGTIFLCPSKIVSRSEMQTKTSVTDALVWNKPACNFINN